MSANDPQGAPFSVPAPAVQLDATGYGYTSVTVPSGVRWEIYATSVSTNETSLTVNPPLVKVYRGNAPSAAQFIEQTFSGNGATSDTQHKLNAGDSLTAEWTGGTPGKIARLRVTGVQFNA